MVMADRNFDEMRNGRRSRGGSPNFSDDSSAAEDSDHDNGMRVGNDYQASIPAYNPDTKQENRAEAILVWAPSIELSDGKVDEYVHIAKEKHGYNTEQALGMLFWHKHNVDKALSDLANFTPFPDEWTVEDKVLFEQAFSFHGKSFHRIRQMLPDKSIAILVKYYYSWKKTRSRTSLMDRQAKKLAGNKEDSDGSDEGSGSPGSDGENNKENGVDRTKSTCSNCNIPTSQLHSTPKGAFCNSCYQYWRRTGVMRSSGSKRHEQQHGVRHAPYKHKRKPPRGMFLNQEDLQSIVTGPPGQGEAILKSLDSELVSLKRQVQNNKQIISMQKHKTASALDDMRPPEVMLRINPRWTNDELLLAVQGVRKYGKDFQAIADVIGNKTEAHVRSFFVIYRQRYNLDEVLAEYETENGLEGPKDTDDDDDLRIIEEKMEVDKAPDESSVLSSSGAQPTVTPPPLLKQPQLSVARSQPHSSLLPPKHTILQQPPPLIRPNPIPVPANGKSLAGLATSHNLMGKD